MRETNLRGGLKVRPNYFTVNRSLDWIAAAAVTVLMFFPMLALAVYLAEPSEPLSSGAAEATVGVGVILRAIGRRLFRAGARNVVRLTFGTMTRAVARTAISRVVRIFVRSVAASQVKVMAHEDEESESQALKQTAFSSFRAVVVGGIATAISFWGVLAINRTAIEDIGLSPIALAMNAAVPLVFIWLVSLIAAKLFRVSPAFATGIDGLGIQAYFTLSGSFLPMTTDIEFQGSRSDVANASIFVLVSLLTVFGALHFLDLTHPSFGFVSAMFLAYAFVYAFPVYPLLGHAIWKSSKLGWLLIFGAVLALFLVWLPEKYASLM